MATTTPDSIYYPTANDTIAPLETVFATQASSVQSALTNSRAIYMYRWTNAAARSAQSGMRIGDRGWQIDTATEYIYQSTGWQPKGVFGYAAGTVTYSGTIAGGAFGTGINVTFPAGRFTVAPLITLTTSHARVTAAYQNKSTTGFRIDTGNWSSGNASAFTIDWTAVQVTPTNAAG